MWFFFFLVCKLVQNDDVWLRFCMPALFGTGSRRPQQVLRAAVGLLELEWLEGTLIAGTGITQDRDGEACRS